MTTTMKIKFDGHQEYQVEAVQAVIDLFDGQPLAGGQFEIRFDAAHGELFSDLGIANALALDDEALLANTRAVQARNEIPLSDDLDGRHFSIEMETATGKTYVYLRTIHELHQRYGFTKFIIVVPTVAIREGVLKNIEITREHFAELYGNTPLDAWVYDRNQVSRLRQFAASNQLQILILNIDAFNKSKNVINQDNDRLSGRKPIEFIQAARPIVIMDEPQNMESALARAAIDSLNPSVTLRYSATHRNLYNLLYRLDPVRAYDLRLVKRIEVDSVLEDADFNQPYIHVGPIETGPSGPFAKLTIDVQGSHGPKRKTLTIRKQGVDLFDVSGERANYRGYIVDEIQAGYHYIAFTNGVTLDEGQTHGGQTAEIMRVQIAETVTAHLEKELEVRRFLPDGERMKVLSLFFIDRVANYVEDDGTIRQWFIEAYTSQAAQNRYASLNLPPVEDVHKGYFSKQGGKEKDTRGDTKADDEAYALIMRDKERLLSPDVPLRFIFSHSALREGWDNPNVFQICTLNQTTSEVKKRQEIGRGMRLPVLESGERCHDPNINILTVVANESYQDFASKLQTEIKEETGVKFGDGRIKNRRERRTVSVKKGWRLDPDFQALWERIKHKTRYSVQYSTAGLIDAASSAVRTMPPIESPSIRTERARIEMSKERGLDPRLVAAREASTGYSVAAIPDLLGYLQRETELTRTTLAAILVGSGRLGDVATNPQHFLDQATRAIRHALHELMIDGIKYERIAGQEYEMLLFEEHEIVAYADRMIDVEHSIYDAIEWDHGIEYNFARELDTRTDIRLFIKLPDWFKVDTPIGTYNPDWAIVKQEFGEDDKLYLVAETKSTQNRLKLRESESDKIECGAAHFAALDVTYKTVISAADV